MSSKIQYLPATLKVVITCNSMATKFLTLTRISDTVEGIRLDGHTWWSIAWWLPRVHNNETILKKLMVATSNGGRSLYDLLETLSPEDLGHLGEYDTEASATIETMLKAVKDALPAERLAKKLECLDWIVQYGFYTSALMIHRLDEKCRGCLEDPSLRLLATHILVHMGYELE
jgi:hypothetical protein